MIRNSQRVYLFLALFLSQTLSEAARAEDVLRCLNPEIQNAQRAGIVQTKDFDFIAVTLLAYSDDNITAQSILGASCDELAPIKESETAERAQTLVAGPWIGYFDLITSPVKGLVLSDAQAAFTRGDETPLLKKYTNALDNMSRRTQAVIKRIRFTAELSLLNQGAYDMKKQEIRAGDFLTRLKAGVPFYFTSPQEVLQSVAETGMGGTCDEFSTLLGWSLARTARHQYASRRVYGNFHVWNRIYTAQYVFDLDNTFYQRFTPLFPRQITGLKEPKRRALHAACTRVQKCIAQ